MSYEGIYDKCVHPVRQDGIGQFLMDAALASCVIGAPPARETQVDDVIPAVGIICFWVASIGFARGTS